MDAQTQQKNELEAYKMALRAELENNRLYARRAESALERFGMSRVGVLLELELQKLEAEEAHQMAG